MLAGLIWSEHTCRSHGRQRRRCCVRPRAPARPSESAASAGDLAYNHESGHPESVPDLLPGVSDSVPSAIILQPKCSVRDCLRWDALGNRPLIFAANGHSSCDCLRPNALLWSHRGRLLGRPLTAVTRVRIPYALPPICRDFSRTTLRPVPALQPFRNPNARLWMARNGSNCVSSWHAVSRVCYVFTPNDDRGRRAGSLQPRGQN